MTDIHIAKQKKVLANLIREAEECLTRGKLRKADHLFGRALPLADETNHIESTASICRGLGLIAQVGGDLEGAEKLYNSALSIYELVQDKNGLITVYLSLGTIAKIQGDMEKATQLYNKSLESCEALGNKEGIATIYYNLGEIAFGGMSPPDRDIAFGFTADEMKNFDIDKAESYFSKSIALHEEIGNKLGAAHGYASLANIAMVNLDTAAAEKILRKAISLFGEVGATEYQRQAKKHLMSLQRMDDFFSGWDK